MNISSKTRYGIMAILEIASSYGNGPMQIREIASRENVSNKYLEQLIAMLKTAGLVNSVRGPRGGYILAKPPVDIQLANVFWALEGKTESAKCFEHACPTPGCADCMTSEIWQELNDAITGVLEKASLADLLEQSK